ncbi:MAG: OmpA family protein [Deltaproteobacteria bacterium]|nr:OmpA family protein [Deltaproteobacteria bacterium]
MSSRMVSGLSVAMGIAMISACGMSKEEHDGLLKQALDERAAACDAEMKKMQAASEEAMNAKDGMISGLEGEIEKLGGDLKKVRGELGDRVVQLAETKTELAASTTELSQLKKLREKAEQEATQFRSLADRLKSMVDAGKLEVVMRKGRINLKLPDDILFPSGSQQLKKEGREALVSVAEVLKEVPGREFLIAGHTDNVPVKRGGRFKSNWDLSTARAVEVVKLMISHGVEPEGLAAAGYGEFDPIAPNDSKEERQKNRRLEIILMPKIEHVALEG